MASSLVHRDVPCTKRQPWRVVRHRGFTVDINMESGEGGFRPLECRLWFHFAFMGKTMVGGITRTCCSCLDSPLCLTFFFFVLLRSIAHHCAHCMENGRFLTLQPNRSSCWLLRKAHMPKADLLTFPTSHAAFVFCEFLFSGPLGE